MKKYLISCSIVIFLAGCANTLQQWEHPEIKGAGAGSDIATLSLAECTAYAAGKTPMPSAPNYMPTPSPSSYTTRGTFSNYGNYGTYNSTTYANSSFASKFAEGQNAGEALGTAIAQMHAQKTMREVASACMRSQGWVDVSTPEGKEKLVTAKSKSTKNQNDATDAWHETISNFLDQEMARPGGIDYRKDKRKFEALDFHVKDIASDPKNDDKKMSWFLIEAHKRVLMEYAK